MLINFRWAFPLCIFQMSRIQRFRMKIQFSLYLCMEDDVNNEVISYLSIIYHVHTLLWFHILFLPFVSCCRKNENLIHHNADLLCNIFFVLSSDLQRYFYRLFGEKGDILFLPHLWKADLTVHSWVVHVTTVMNIDADFSCY